jgi:hypothetical protein
MFPLQLPHLASIIICVLLIAVPFCGVMRSRRDARREVQVPALHPALHPAPSGAGAPPETPRLQSGASDIAGRNRFVARGGPASWRLWAPIPVETGVEVQLTDDEKAAFRLTARLEATDEARAAHQDIVDLFLGRTS